MRHPVGALGAEEGRLVSRRKGVDVVAPRVQVFDCEDVIAIGELAMAIAESRLPPVCSGGARVSPLRISEPGLGFEHAVVEYDFTRLFGRGKGGFDASSRVAV